MSAKTIGTTLDKMDEQREELIVRLPWYKRLHRRYLTGDAFWAYNISSLLTWPQAFGAGLIFSKLWAGWLIKYPAATAVATKFWGFVTTAAAAVWAVLSP